MTKRQILLGGALCALFTSALVLAVGCDVDPNQISVGGIPVVDMLRERLAEILARFGG